MSLRDLALTDGDELEVLVPQVMYGSLVVVPPEFSGGILAFDRKPCFAMVVHRMCPGLFMAIHVLKDGEAFLMHGGRCDLPSVCSVFDEVCTPASMRKHYGMAGASSRAQARYAYSLMDVFIDGLQPFVDSRLTALSKLYVQLQPVQVRSLLSAWLCLQRVEHPRMRKRERHALH